MSSTTQYTEGHEWVLMDKGIGIVGITKFAQKELGEIVYVELPEVGKTVQSGSEIAVLESTKSAVDIYSPISGVIVAVNEKLRENPSLINEDPEANGWIAKIQIDE